MAVERMPAVSDLLAFFHDRLKVQLRESGARHDLVDAVLSGGGARGDDLLDITRRVTALGAFLDTEDGQNLLAGTRRAANILAAEEKKGTRVADAVARSPHRARGKGAGRCHRPGGDRTRRRAGGPRTMPTP